MQDATSIPTLNPDTPADGKMPPPGDDLSDEEFNQRLNELLAEPEPVAAAVEPAAGKPRKLKKEEKSIVPDNDPQLLALTAKPEPVTQEVVESVRRMLQLSPENWTPERIDDLRAEVPRDQFIKLTSRILMTMNFKSMYQMEKLMAMAPQLLEKETEGRVKVSLGYLIAKLGPAMAEAALAMEKMAEKAAGPAPPPVPDRPRRNLPPSLNVQVNVAGVPGQPPATRQISSTAAIDSTSRG